MKLQVSRKKTFITTLFYFVLLIFVVATISPFLYITLASFQSQWAIMTGEIKLIPREIHFENYIDLLFTKTEGAVAFGRNVLNSLKVAVGVMFVTIAIATLGAYGLSRYNFRGKELIAKLMLTMYVFPTVLIVTPVYDVMSAFKLVNTHVSLILIHATLSIPFCIWLLRSFIDSIPKEIEEAALVDGANRWQTFRRIIFPLASSGILTAGVYAMIYSWGEYLFVSIFIYKWEKHTIPTALTNYSTQFSVQWTKLLAGTVFNVLPILILFMLLIKSFLRGFMEGAVKK
jgi:multiple sugar transport system permease protein